MEKHSVPSQTELLVSRVTRSKQAAREFYDRLCRWYDLLSGPDQQMTRLGLDWLALQPDQRALDIGCGTGAAMRELAGMTGGKARLSGCDLSPGMLARARIKLRREGERASLICADAVRLPHGTSAFDAVLLSFTLELFDTPEIPLVLAECRRILKPGGRLVVIALAKTDQPGWMERVYEWVHSRAGNIADCRPIYALHFLEQAGFHACKQLRRSIWGLPVDIILAVSPSEEER